MSQVKSKRIYYISSADRTSGTTSAFGIPIEVPTEEKFDSITLLDCSIPVSYYLVPSGYNTFVLSEPTQVDVTITIPVGNYSIGSFCSTVGPLLTTASLSGFTYILTYQNGFSSALNGLITTTVTGNAGVQPTLTFSSQNYIKNQFGLSSLSNTFTGSTLVSNQVCDFTTESYLLIHSDLANNGSNDVLQGVYQGNSSNMQFIQYEATQPLVHAKALSTNKNQLIHFYLTDSQNVPINLNGLDWSITLMLFKKDDVNEKLSEFMKFIVQSM